MSKKLSPEIEAAVAEGKAVEAARNKLVAAAASGGVRMASTEIKVFGPDGKLKRDYGVVSYYHKNPLRMFAWRLQQWLSGKRAGRFHFGAKKS